jgi:flavin-dependent dehydrogenase
VSQQGTNFEVGVIGGGPAGSATALSLARIGRRVILFDRGEEEGFRGGETLPPEINALVESLGLESGFASLGSSSCPGTVSVWGSDHIVETDFIRNPYGCGWHVDRHHFDRMLLNCASRSGVQVVSPCRVTACRASSLQWEVTSRFSGGTFSVCCRAIVDASGRNGFRGAAPYSRVQDDRLVALIFEFSKPESDNADARTYVESAPRGWWYSAPTARGTWSVMFFTDRRTYAEHGIEIAAQLSPCRLTSRRIEGATLVSEQIVHARSCLNREPVSDGWISAGDSACCFDPISGLGVWKALSDGSAAASSIDSWLNGSAAELSAYAARIRGRFELYSRQRIAYYTSEHRWPEEHFWCRWHAAAGVE